jgi:hypothetical protein
MAGSLVSDYGIGDTNFDNMMLTLDKVYKGKKSLTFTEINSREVPQIAAGSWADVNGALYKFDSNESISTTDPVTSSTVASGIIYIVLIPSGSSCTAAFTATAPTFSDSKQGWYGSGGLANYRYVGITFKTDLSSMIIYTRKILIENNGNKDSNEFFKRSFLPNRGWRKTPLAVTSVDWDAVVYSPSLGLYAAVAAAVATNTIMTSTDGEFWTARTSPASIPYRDICWSEDLGLFCAVASSTSTSSIVTSSDGVTWTARSYTNSAGYYCVEWSPELSIFVALEGDVSGTANSVITSSDGITWTQSTGLNLAFRSIAWAPEISLFCAVGSTGAVATSPDGTTWTSRTAAASNSWEGIAWAGRLNRFVVVGRSGTNDRVMYSSDGITWTSAVTPIDNNWYDIAWSNEINLFVACAGSGTGDRIMTSNDGITWTTRKVVEDYFWKTICWNDVDLNFVMLSYDNSGPEPSAVGMVSDYGVF